jgi:uncharacterized membrane protein
LILKVFGDRPWRTIGLLLLWMVIGVGLRLIGLTAKPLWTDEFSTIVFSLGHSFQTIPLDQVISSETLLAPLQVNPPTDVNAVLHHLLSESNHPPLYFVLTHLWLSLFPPMDGYVSVFAVRSLATLFSILSIPAAYGLGWLALRSPVVGHLSALLMAVSPFGIYLAQEARHYTLPIVWVMASLACLLQAARQLRDRQPLPYPLICLWIVVNSLGIATHYFFILTLAAEALVLLVLGLLLSLHKQMGRFIVGSSRLAWAIAGTAVGAAVWLPFLTTVQNSDLTEWLYRQGFGAAFIDSIAQAIAGLITMLYLAPIQAPTEIVKRLSGTVLILLLLWTLPKLIRGWQIQTAQPEPRFSLQILAGFVAGAIAIFLGMTYGLGMNLPSAFRYNFVYFPAVVVLLAIALAPAWERTQLSLLNQQSNGFDPPSPPLKRGGLRRRGWQWVSGSSQRTVILIICFSLLGGLTVSCDLAYKKPNLPNVVATAIREDAIQSPNTPILIAIPHYTHGQTGRLMGVAWDLHQHPGTVQQPQFLLAHENPGSYSSLAVLQDVLQTLPRPLDIWLLNFPALLEEVKPRSPLREVNCVPRSRLDGIDGYRYQRYRCFPRRT